MVTVVPLDTKDKIVTLYEERSGVTPEFPIVDFSGGGRTIAELFGFAAGGQAHMMHPDLEFERIPSTTSMPYKKDDMIPGIQTALDDDCETGNTPIDTKSISKNVPIGINFISSEGIVFNNSKGIYKVSLFNIMGKKVFYIEKDLSFKPVISFGKRKLANGSYILKVKNKDALNICRFIIN